MLDRRTTVFPFLKVSLKQPVFLMLYSIMLYPIFYSLWFYL